MMPDYVGSNGRTEEEIAKAEKKIGITFAKDYREYLKEIGLACFDGHELTLSGKALMELFTKQFPIQKQKRLPILYRNIF